MRALVVWFAVAAMHLCLTPFAGLVGFMAVGGGNRGEVFLVPFYIFCWPLLALGELGLHVGAGSLFPSPGPLMLNTALWVGSLDIAVRATGLWRVARGRAAAEPRAAADGGGV